MADKRFPSQIIDGTPAGDDRLLFSDTSNSNATRDCTIDSLPISTATQAALDDKANSADVYTAAEVDTFLGNKQNVLGYAPLDSVVAGTNITVDNTDPLNPIISASGAAAGDMIAATYDPTNVASDVFDMDNMQEGTTNKILTSGERTVIENSKGIIVVSGNADAQTTGGRYGMIGTPTNGPKAGEFALEVYNDGTRIMQIATFLDNTVATRYYNGSVWSSWVLGTSTGTNTGDNAANTNSGLVHTTGAETIAGAKTFTSIVTVDNNSATKGVSAINTNNSGGISAGYFENDNNGSGTNYAEFALSAGDSRSNRFYRNLAAATTGGPVVQVWQDNVGDDQSPIRVINDGTGAGVFINNTGSGYGLIVDAGNVGIGNVAPVEKMDVTGNIKLSGNIELGHATDTTLSRSAAGKLAVEGVNVGTEGIVASNLSTDYTIVQADNGKKLYHPSADTTARTWTLSSGLSSDFTVTLVNDTSAGAITIASGSDALVWMPTGGTGNRTLAANGMATITNMTTTRKAITGVGLT